jgi:uncharacterized protein YndB with AHSA1/START domain
MFTTHVFGFATGATPGQVWSALTDAARTPRWMCGLALESAWVPGSRLVLRHGDVPAATGDVVAVEPGERLSYAIHGGLGPATYLTWTVRASGAGSIVRLAVDDAQAGTGADGREAEDTWLPVLADLHAVLAG